MKLLITKIRRQASKYADESAVGEVHLQGAIDSMACGLADEEYEVKDTNKPITCITCKTFHNWAKSVAKIKS